MKKMKLAERKKDQQFVSRVFLHVLYARLKFIINGAAQTPQKATFIDVFI